MLMVRYTILKTLSKYTKSERNQVYVPKCVLDRNYLNGPAGLFAGPAGPQTLIIRRRPFRHRQSVGFCWCVLSNSHGNKAEIMKLNYSAIWSNTYKIDTLYDYQFR